MNGSFKCVCQAVPAAQAWVTHISRQGKMRQFSSKCSEFTWIKFQMQFIPMRHNASTDISCRPVSVTCQYRIETVAYTELIFGILTFNRLLRKLGYPKNWGTLSQTLGLENLDIVYPNATNNCYCSVIDNIRPRLRTRPSASTINWCHCHLLITLWLQLCV